MLSSVSESLELILDRYAEARVGEAFGSQHELWSVFEDLKRTLSNRPSVVARPTLRATWSAGQGNWAKVPWIALLEEQETGTTQRGVYCVFLFRQDMSGVYLTFNQGVTQPKNQHGRPRAHQLLQNKATDLRRLCGDLVKREFNLDDDIDLRTDSGLGSDYENSTVAYKFYEAGQVPTDDLLSEDLEAVLKAYDRYLAHSKKWKEAIDICRQILSDREAFDSQETGYKREIA